MRGKLITLEGLDCAGKSSHIKDTEACLTERSIRVLITREPGGSDLGLELRKILLEPDYQSMDRYTELLLMFADRNEHIKKVINPALNEGTWVLCERFTDASYAYQSAARGIDKALVDTLVRYVVKELKPDLTFLLDIDPSVAVQRIGKQQASPDRFEREGPEFFMRIADAYRKMANSDTQRWRIIDGTQSYNMVQNKINDEILRLIK